MPTLQIRFVSGKGWDSKLIEWYSGFEWSHVELINGQNTFGAQLHGGVKWRKTSDPCYAKAAKFEVWEVPITDRQLQMLLKLRTDAIGALYDWPAIVSFALGPRFRFHLPGRWICSGYLAGVLQSLQLAVIDFPLENYEPAHVRMLVPQILGAKKIS